jgi:tRNA pseudouridine38-40 synthase
MQNWKLEIEYDGSRYYGWQQQPNARTVQGELIKAATAFLGATVEIGGAGRTDAGVHACGQVAHLRAAKPISPASLQINLNDRLPHDINILSVKSASNRFNARKDALARYYLYQISTRRTAFGKAYVWWIKDRLKFEDMERACQLLPGMHDFRSFSEASEGSTLVKVAEARLAQVGSLILFRIAASHFLWKMVRRIVGALVEIGRGKLLLTDFAKLLKEYSGAPAAWTAPPAGLFLEKIIYPGDPHPTNLAPVFPII